MSDRKTKRDLRKFNRWSRSYEASWQQRFFGLVHQRMLAMVDASAVAVVLDVGCGTGRLLRAAAKRCPNATLIGVDPAEGMIEVAVRHTPGATFHVAGAEALPLPTTSVDVALSSISFHHWPNQRRGLEEIARVLRPGGQLCLADPVMPTWLAPIVRSYAKSPRTLRALLTDAGFRVKKQSPILWGIVYATLCLKDG
jgi:ubiquinone/menaquinone biosynthesis C-methylase UbiE